MATITFTFEEILAILISNELLPPQITCAKVKDNSINFVINTEVFLLPHVPASLRYNGFENGIAKFELTVVSGHFNKALGWFGQSYESKLPEYIKLELPNILVYIEKLFQEKNIRGISIKELTLHAGLFSLVTENT